MGPSSPLRGAQIGFGGTRWDPVGPSPSLRGPYTPFWFYNANEVEGGGRPHDNHFHCPLVVHVVQVCVQPVCAIIEGEPGTTNVDR